jgi:hypothetical protein
MSHADGTVASDLDNVDNVDDKLEVFVELASDLHMLLRTSPMILCTSNLQILHFASRKNFLSHAIECMSTMDIICNRTYAHSYFFQKGH